MASLQELIQIGAPPRRISHTAQVRKDFTPPQIATMFDVPLADAYSMRRNDRSSTFMVVPA